MPVENIPYVSVGDKIWTFMSSKLANWIISRTNVLSNIKVKPDGSGFFDIGEEGATLWITSSEDSGYPYKVYPNGEARVSIQPGTHGGILPTVNGVSIEVSPAQTLSVPSGSSYIYAKLSSDSDGVIEEGDVIIDIFNSTQTNDDPNEDGTDAEFYDLIATITRTNDSISISNVVNNSRAFIYCSGMVFSY